MLTCWVSPVLVIDGGSLTDLQLTATDPAGRPPREPSSASGPINAPTAVKPSRVALPTEDWWLTMEGSN